MSKEQYFIIEINEDGEVSVYANTAEDMAKLININLEEDLDAEIDANECNETIPEDADPNCWEKSILIIKGKVVAPRPVAKVLKYEID